MYNRIKNKIEKTLRIFVHKIDKDYSLNKISTLLSKSIKDFVLRKGKRIRPILFVIGYLGFAQKKAANLYISAISIELLHDFMLVHDDIIDKSDTRRNKPSLHKMLDNYLRGYNNIKFNGQDLSIVTGDVIYAMAIDAFLSIKEDFALKQKALKNFIKAAMFTGCGEFIELLNGLKNIEKITKPDIYKIYDYKTAYYTFACPLSTGAMLAGAKQNQINKLLQYGIYLGRAFQIKDDILGMFAEENKIGKSTLSDLQEAKKTIIVWYAYNHTNNKNKLLIKNIFSKQKVSKSDLSKMRKIITNSGSLIYAKREMMQNLKEAELLIDPLALHPKYKNFLSQYSKKLLHL